MKKLMILAALGLSIACGAFAYDKGPDLQAYTNAPAFTPLVISPAGQGERFEPETLFFSAPANQTQTVYWVVGVTTNTVGSFIPSASSHDFSVTNVPALYNGDKLVIVPSGVTSTTNSVWLYGRRWN